MRVGQKLASVAVTCFFTGCMGAIASDDARQLAGVPVFDSDRDGVPNHLDDCICVGGNNLSEAGCPRGRQQAMIRWPPEYKITQQARFEEASSEASRSKDLDVVAIVLLNNPGFDVELLGYSDDLENDPALALARARSVRQLLIDEYGVESERLELANVRGLRPRCRLMSLARDKPDSEELASCRADNRAVTFRLTSIDGKPTVCGDDREDNRSCCVLEP